MASIKKNQYSKPKNNKFTPLNKQNGGCPVCDKDDGRCRASGDLILCMTSTAYAGDISGYKDIGLTKDGQWRKYIPSNQYNSTSEARSTRKRRERKIRQAKIEERAKRLAKRQKREQLDKSLTRVSSQCGLNDNCKKLLRNRGLTDELIQKYQFWSIDPDKRLTDIPTHTPGVSDDKFKIKPTDKGFACPFFDIQGRLIGYQLRNENTENGKYKWAINSKLKNDELPITVINPNSDKALLDSVLGVSEGSLKPLIAAHKHNIRMMGCPGGMFNNSPQQVKEIIGNETKTIIIFPDGGDMKNFNVMNRWKNQYKFFRKLGLFVLFAWWEQTTKNNNDIDEIDSLEEVKLISPDSFFAKGEAYFNWLNSKKFTPDIKLNQEYLNLAAYEENCITAVKSGLGTGKTTDLIEKIKLIAELTQDIENWLNLGYRNTLQIQFCEKSGFNFIHDSHKIPRDINSKLENLALAVNSITRLNNEDFDGINLTLDELVSFIKYLLFSSTLNKIREVVIKKFEEAVRRSNRIIIMDGNLTDWAVDYISSICPEKKVKKIENTFKKPKPIINWLDGCINQKGKLNPNERSNLLDLLSKSLLPVICTDSQHFGETMDKLLTSEGHRVLRIDSKTIAEKILSTEDELPISEVEWFLQNPAEFIANSPPFILIYNTSAESGLDINIINHFSEMYCFFFGVVDVDTYLQLIARIRDNIPRYIWVREAYDQEDKWHLRSPFPKKIGENITELLNQDLNSITPTNKEEILQIISQIIENSVDIHYETAKLIQSSINYEKAHLRECLKERLIATGYTIQEFTGFKNDNCKDKYKNASDEIKTQDAEDILNSNYLPQDTNIDSLNQGMGLQWKRPDSSISKPDRVGVINLQIRQKLPGIDKSSLWNTDFIKKIHFDNKKLIKHWENLYLFLNPEVAKRQTDLKYFSLLKEEKISLHKLDFRNQFIEALHEAGFMELYQQGFYSQSDPVAIALFNRIKKDLNLQKRLGLMVGKKNQNQYLGILLKRLGINSNSKGRGIDKVYSFELDLDLEKILGFLATRWKKYNDFNFKIEWEQRPTEETAQTQIQIDLNPLTQHTQKEENYIYLASCVSNKNKDDSRENSSIEITFSSSEGIIFKGAELIRGGYYIIKTGLDKLTVKFSHLIDGAIAPPDFVIAIFERGQWHIEIIDSQK